MLLKELAAASGCSAASIKFYRREGLLPAGEFVTATRQDYGSSHLERLHLIQVLREVADAPISAIRRLTELLDDPQVPQIRALEEAQAIVLGTRTVDESPTTDNAEHPTVDRLLAQMGWPDIDSVPRRALNEVLKALEDWNMSTEVETIMRYAIPIAEIARGDVEFLQTRTDPSGDTREEKTRSAVPTNESSAEQRGAPPGQPSDDVVVVRAVAGAIVYGRLIQVLRSLGHVSLSVRAAGPQYDA